MFLECVTYRTGGLSEVITGSCDSESSIEISMGEWLRLAAGSTICLTVYTIKEISEFI